MQLPGFWLTLLIAPYSAQQSRGVSERARLLHLIERNPGLHLRELQRRTSSGWGALVHHLRTLCRERRVRLERNGRFLVAYAAGAASLPLAAGAFMHGEARRICLALGPDGSTQAEVAQALDISRQLAAYHLRRLIERGAVHVLDVKPKRYLAADWIGEAP